MADLNIDDLPAFVAIDRANDLIEQKDVSASTNNKMTPNQMLGITGAPLGTTDIQSPTNKTFDNTNAATFKGNKFTLQDQSDTSKQAVFSMASITTATIRTYTWPDASGTVVLTGATQTLTGKTLTSPVINTATINNPTLNTDAVNEFTSDHGVTVDGLNIHNGTLNTNNSVVTANVTDGAITPAKLVAGTGSGWAWTSWAPTWTNLTVGNGTQVAKYTQIGKTIIAKYGLIMGNTSALSGDTSFSLPITAAASLAGANLDYIGTAVMFDGATTINLGYVTLTSSTTANIRVINAAATYAAQTNLSSTVPFTWGVNKTLSFEIMYEAA